jgi:hypothetical protein
MQGPRMIVRKNWDLGSCRDLVIIANLLRLDAGATGEPNSGNKDQHPHRSLQGLRRHFTL